MPAAIEMNSLPLPECFLAAFREFGRQLRHHGVDRLRLDGEQHRAGFAHDFDIVVGGRDFERAREFAAAVGRNVGDNYFGGLENLVLDQPVGERLGHIAAADESQLLHFGRSPKTARPIRTMVAPSSIATSKSSDMPMESSLSA